MFLVTKLSKSYPNSQLLNFAARAKSEYSIQVICIFENQNASDLQYFCELTTRNRYLARN